MKKIISKLDFLGMSTSMICALHCMAMPIISSISTLPGVVSTHNHAFDITFVLIGLCVATFTLLKDISKHQSYMPILIGGIGFVLLLIGVSRHDHIPVLNILGGVMVFVSHILNYKLTTGIKQAF